MSAIIQRILIPKNNLEILAKDQRVDNLSIGQIGLFNEKGISIDETNISSSFKFAVGMDQFKSGELSEVRYSGRIIQKNSIIEVCKQEYLYPQQKVVEIKNIKTSPGGEYSISIDVVNDEVLKFNANRPYNIRATYSAKTTGGVTDSNIAVKNLVALLNDNSNDYIVAEAINPASNTVITDIDAFITTNSTVNTDTDLTNDVNAYIRITGKDVKQNPFSQLNLIYNYPRQSNFNVFVGNDFINNSTINIVNESRIELGSGYDVHQLEEYSNGYEVVGPYRTDSGTRLAKTENVYESDINLKYVIYTITYRNPQIQDTSQKINSLSLTIAVSTLDTNTIGSLDTITNVLK